MGGGRIMAGNWIRCLIKKLNMKFWIIAGLVLSSFAGCQGTTGRKGNASGRDSASSAGKGHYAYQPDSSTVNKNTHIDIKDSLKKADANKR